MPLTPVKGVFAVPFIESEKLDNLKCSPFFSQMTDESTDISVLKQLVIVAKYILPSGKIETSFLHIGDIADGTVETIEVL